LFSIVIVGSFCLLFIPLSFLYPPPPPASSPYFAHPTHDFFFCCSLSGVFFFFFIVWGRVPIAGILRFFSWRLGGAVWWPFFCVFYLLCPLPQFLRPSFFLYPGLLLFCSIWDQLFLSLFCFFLGLWCCLVIALLLCFTRFLAPPVCFPHSQFVVCGFSQGCVLGWVGVCARSPFGFSDFILVFSFCEEGFALRWVRQSLVALPVFFGVCVVFCLFLRVGGGLERGSPLLFVLVR